MTAMLDKAVADANLLRHARLSDALIRLTVASDTDAVAVAVDTDDLTACQQWLWARTGVLKQVLAYDPAAELAYAAVTGMTTPVSGRAWFTERTVLSGQDLAAYVGLLHAVHADVADRRYPPADTP